MGILSKHVWVVVRKRGPSGVWAVGVVRARGGARMAAFSPQILSKHLGNASQVSGEAGVGWGVGGGGGEGAGVCGNALAKYSLNT